MRFSTLPAAMLAALIACAFVAPHPGAAQTATPTPHVIKLDAAALGGAPATDWQTMTELSKVDFTGLTPAQKDTALKILREEGCTCGCGMKLAECRVKDSNCPKSPGMAKDVIDQIKAGKSEADIRAGMKAAAPPAPAPAAKAATLDSTKHEIPIKDAPFKGPADAKVTIVEFSDFQCPFCAQATAWADSIVAAYPKDVKLVFKQYPLAFHNQAHISAQASLAAHAQGKFWPMHDKLFANFRTLSRENIDTWAKELGLDMEKFKKALDEGTYKAKVDAELAEGQKVGVTGTPTFYINGRRYNGGRDLASVKPVIDGELKGGYKDPAAAAAPVNPDAGEATKK